MYYDAKCPYCGYEFDVDEPPDEANELYTHECDECGKIFLLSYEISLDYSTKEASCQNGGEHDWKLTNHYPPLFVKERCSICEEEREPEIKENITEKKKRVAKYEAEEAEYKAQKEKKERD